MEAAQRQLALLQGDTGAVAYARFAVDLPVGAFTGGLRHSMCTELSTIIPVEFVAVASGHDIKGLSSPSGGASPNTSTS